MPARKKVLTTVKLGKLEAGEANPAKVGQALGAHGINIMEFCRAYNAATESRRGEFIPADVTIYEDRSFSFVTRTPPTAKLLLEAAGIERGSAEPHVDKVADITREQLRAVALRKLPDLNTRDLDQAERIVAGTARSMGITIKD